MELKEIRQIVALMNQHGLSLFHLEKKDFTIKLKKGMDLGELREILAVRSPGLAVPAEPETVGGKTHTAAPEEPVDDHRIIASPMVGTFYRKPTPDAEEFVKVGENVAEGQTLCIIEAMKVMNEIRAENAGVIAEICVEDATPVQYGDVLFRMK